MDTAIVRFMDMRALGVDYGEKRIGLALSDATGLLARAWKTVQRTGNPSQVAAALAAEVQTLAGGRRRSRRRRALDSRGD